MIHEILIVGPLQCNCSILGDEDSREAIVVDPGDDISRIVSALKRHNLTVKQIIITHAHIDHIAGAQSLKRVTGAPILYNQNDLPLVKMMDIQAGWLSIPTPEVAPPDASLEDGQTVSIAGLTGSILHTPGHTEGSVCLYLPQQKLLLAGDTLFAGSVGRTDLPGGNTRKLLQSIRDSLLPLPDEVTVIPGHGHGTTIGEERDSNPFLI
ncbi:MAG: MBL fold metallo-hydrolase [Acidobacteriales bacterium 59-55]|mgnify:CR=1 FL=1|nr:MBL fold metallo-hydrolase [Terriglobales bacterium]OJV41509.1 MAG: MBL fold metallo-hydrolase [Acidobacteriales bacterium 59-55]